MVAMAIGTTSFTLRDPWDGPFAIPKNPFAIPKKGLWFDAAVNDEDYALFLHSLATRVRGVHQAMTETNDVDPALARNRPASADGQRGSVFSAPLPTGPAANSSTSFAG